MSDQQIPVNGSELPGEGPPLKKPCTIDTPPVASTPDDGSDFYNTPLGAGTPVTNANAEPAAAPAIERTSSAQQDTAIPGLGLISNPNAQQAPPTATTEPNPQVAVVESETNETTTKPDGNEMDIQQEQVESTTAQDPANQPPATTTEAMEVDEKPEQNNLDANNGLMENKTGEEQGEDDHPEWEVDSSPYESSSDSSSDSDDSSEDEDYPILSPEEQARILMQAEAGSDDEGEGKGKSGGYIRSANEVVEDVLPIPDVQVTPEMAIVYLGKIKTLIENAVLIEANTSGEYQVLESGSLLCSEDRKVLGVVAETLGRVENPLYTVMYATAAEPKERGLEQDMAIYYVTGHSTFVFTQPLKGLKGSDASNFHDEEVADEEIEFSDDEAEAEYKKRLKQKRQERKEAKEGGGRGRKGPAGPSKLSHSELNYDDAGGEDGYTPLARPKNLHEMMGSREAPVEGTERGSGFRGGRGRGRGSDRGRGGRGRGSGGRGGGSFDRDQDRRPQHQNQSPNQQGGNSQYAPAAPQHQPAGYGQPTYPQQPPAFGMPQAFAPYQQYAPQQQTQQLPQGVAPGQFPFQFPFQQPFAQPNPFQTIPPGAHINPLFLAALQQQQQFQQPQAQGQPQQGQQAAPPQQNPAMNFDQVKAQLDLLRNLSNNQGNNQGPPPS